MKKEFCTIIKKNGTREAYNREKIISAIGKSAERAMYVFKDYEINFICQSIEEEILLSDIREIQISKMHHMVETALEKTNPAVAKCYRDYRNYKTDFVAMLDGIYKESQSIMYIGNKENSNTDSALVSTKRSLVFNQLNKELYQKFFLNIEELQAARDGYIYIHDMSARRDTMNCCLFNVANVMNGGFEMGNIWYNEPKTLDTAFDVLGDIVLSAAGQQYGGFTVPEIDKILAKYAKKSYKRYYKKYYDKYMEVSKETLETVGLSYDGLSKEQKIETWKKNGRKAKEEAMNDVQREMSQGFQGLEIKFNTVASSRGDYPFITFTAGIGTGKFERMASTTMFNVRKGGQGKPGFKRPVLFPKLVFLYDKNLHSENCINYEVYKAGLECSCQTMYPDWLSLTGEGYVPSIYKQYGKAISPMGCRAFLSPWFEKGGMKPADEHDMPVFEGRFNIGAISLHLPMILAKSRQEGKDFYEVLDYYLELIRKLHLRTYAYLGEMKASTNPLAYCEGGFYGGNLGLHDKIKPVLESATASFGVTALNELQMLYNGKSLVQDGEFAIEVMEHINAKVEEFKHEDGRLYAIYGTPAENLCGLQVRQFRNKFGVIEGVSDKEYVSNSFHCHVSEDISPILKQDLEARFWNLFNGGKIQYVRHDLNYNVKAIETLILRAMDLGFYEGVNLSLAYCEDCGHFSLNADECPHCKSKNLTKIDRMNGYLSYSRVHGDTRLNDAKMIEIKDRKSM